MGIFQHECLIPPQSPIKSCSHVFMGYHFLDCLIIDHNPGFRCFSGFVLVINDSVFGGLKVTSQSSAHFCMTKRSSFMSTEYWFL